VGKPWPGELPASPLEMKMEMPALDAVAAYVSLRFIASLSFAPCQAQILGRNPAAVRAAHCEK
jgi:hypothetical protein